MSEEHITPATRQALRGWQARCWLAWRRFWRPLQRSRLQWDGSRHSAVASARDRDFPMTGTGKAKRPRGVGAGLAGPPAIPWPPRAQARHPRGQPHASTSSHMWAWPGCGQDVPSCSVPCFPAEHPALRSGSSTPAPGRCHHPSPLRLLPPSHGSAGAQGLPCRCVMAGRSAVTARSAPHGKSTSSGVLWDAKPNQQSSRDFSFLPN